LFAYPGSVGIQWDATGKFALRFDGDYDRNQTTLTSGMGDPPPRFPAAPIVISSSIETTTQAGSLGASALFTLHARDQLRIYVAPRVGVEIVTLTSRTEWDVSGIPPALLAALTVPANEERSTTDIMADIRAIFGASYRVGERFGVFGETGVGYTGGTASATSSTVEIERSSFGLRAGIGGILYF
jgi:hypothetical protein